MQFMIRGYAGSTFYPIDDIKQMRHAWRDTRGGEHPASIEFKDGRAIQVDDTDINRIVRQTTPILPALPGCQLLSFGYMPDEDDGGPWFHREPIMGWRDGQYGGLDPVVIDYYFDEMENQHAILHADGQIQIGERWFKSEAEWADYMKSTADADHARLQRAKAAEAVQAAEQAGGADGPAA